MAVPYYSVGLSLIALSTVWFGTAWPRIQAFLLGADASLAVLHLGQAFGPNIATLAMVVCSYISGSVAWFVCLRPIHRLFKKLTWYQRVYAFLKKWFYVPAWLRWRGHWIMRWMSTLGLSAAAWYYLWKLYRYIRRNDKKEKGDAWVLDTAEALGIIASILGTVAVSHTVVVKLAPLVVRLAKLLCSKHSGVNFSFITAAEDSIEELLDSFSETDFGKKCYKHRVKIAVLFLVIVVVTCLVVWYHRRAVSDKPTYTRLPTGQWIVTMNNRKVHVPATNEARKAVRPDYIGDEGPPDGSQPYDPRYDDDSQQYDFLQDDYNWADMTLDDWNRQLYEDRNDDDHDHVHYDPLDPSTWKRGKKHTSKSERVNDFVMWVNPTTGKLMEVCLHRCTYQSKDKRTPREQAVALRQKLAATDKRDILIVTRRYQAKGFKQMANLDRNPAWFQGKSVTWPPATKKKVQEKVMAIRPVMTVPLKGPLVRITTDAGISNGCRVGSKHVITTYHAIKDTVQEIKDALNNQTGLFAMVGAKVNGIWVEQQYKVTHCVDKCAILAPVAGPGLMVTPVKKGDPPPNNTQIGLWTYKTGQDLMLSAGPIHLDGDKVLYSATTEGGWSGSPYLHDGKVFALHEGVESFGNYGFRIKDEVFDVCNGLN